MSQKVAESSKPCGFTLIELMIVIAIIGLLSGIAVPKWIEAKKRANRIVCKKNLAMLNHRMILYNLEHGHFPGESGAPPWKEALKPYFAGSVFPSCPYGVEYQLEKNLEGYNDIVCPLHGTYNPDETE